MECWWWFLSKLQLLAGGNGGAGGNGFGFDSSNVVNATSGASGSSPGWCSWW